MKNQKNNKIEKQRIEIENKKVWNKWSSNDLYDMYAETTEDGNEFTLHAKGKKKIKTPPPPIDPPGDIQKTLNLILQKLNQHDQYFVEVKNDISQVKTEVNQVKSEIKNVNARVDEVKSEVKKINKRIDTIVELNHLKTDDNK